MGNTLIEDKGKINLMKSFETYNTEQIIGVRGQVFFDSKLFKTIHYKLHQQNLLVKVHLMRKQLTQAELQIHTQNFNYLKEQLQMYPNLMPFRNLINFGSTQKQIEPQQECNKDYLAVSRQLLYITLEERLQSNYKLPRCLLNYYTLQLLRAVCTLHQRHLYHGHIRSSNVLLTTNDFLVLADFASYKPTYLNELEVIRNIYKSSIQKCTLAPEKYNDLQEIQSLVNLTKQQIVALQKMDMFSVGCVIAEIYTGESLFSLEQMLQFRKGEYEPQFRVDGSIGDLIRNLISLSPDARFTAEQALHTFQADFCSSQTYELITYLGVALNANGYFMQPDVRVALMRKIISSVEKKIFNYALPISLQFVNLSKFNQICKETDYPQKAITISFSGGVSIDEVIATTLENGQNLIQKEFRDTSQDSFSVQTSMVQRLKQSIQKPMDSVFSRQTFKSSTYTNVDLRQSNQEYIILLLWLFNSMRFCRFMQTRLCGLEIAEFLSQYLDDELSYTLIVPNLGYFCEDSEPQVQYYAFTIMLQIVKRIKVLPQSPKETLIFKLYIWDHIKNRLKDMSVNNQIALRIGDIAEILHNYGRAEEKIQFLELLTSKLKESKNNELILIISKLGDVLRFYEKKETENFLLHLISLFNNPSLKIPMWEVFLQLYKHYRDIKDGQILLACLETNIRQEGALFHIVRIIRMATEENLLEFDKIKQYVKQVAPLILHHNRWIREEVQKFIAILLEKFTSLQIYLFVHPHISKYLKLDVPHVTLEIFQQLIQKPISSKWFDNKLQQEPKFPLSLSEREQFNYKNYYEEFFKKSKLVPEVGNPMIQKNQNPTAKLNTRVNELIESAFNASLMQLDVNNWGEFSRKGKTWDDFVNYLKTNNIDVSGKFEQLTKKKVKYVQELQLQLQYQLPQSCTQWVNLLNYNIIANQITIKSQQLQVQDLQFTRTILQYPYRPFKLSNQLVTTIPEHKGIVTSLQRFSDQRRFISGSYDGTVKIYDMKKIEEDFTNGSVASIPIKEGDINSRVTALCTIEGTESFVVGTNTGAVSLYTNDRHTSTFIKGDSEIRKIVDQENTFMYVTEKGTLTLEDIRCKNGQRFNIGRQRGLVSSMVHDNYTTLIGTINGYLMIYDIRSTMIVNLFQLLNHEDQPLPIFSLANMNRISQLDGFISDSSKLVGIGFQSNNNEVGFWDINKQNEDLNPALFLYCSDKKHPIIETPRLQAVLKAEQFINHNNNLQQQCYYDFFNKQVDLISYLKDPLTTSERSAKNKWLSNTKNLYINLKSAFECKSTVTSLLCLNSKVENTFITASTDRSILSWTLNSDGPKEKSTDKEFTTNVICSPFNSVRKYKQCPSGDVYIIQDYEFKSGSANGIEHKDCITDMAYLDNENSYLITASRDHTIKIWK